MKQLGIIGGLGPMATAYFFELITGMADVKTDQEHIPVLMQSIPGTPDRTDYILNHKCPNPLPNLIEAGKNLKQLGADYIAIPCMTAHYFYQELCEQIGLPIISMTEYTALEFQRQNVSKVGILATTGTVKSGLLQSTLEKYGIESVIPTREDQNKVMEIIYDQVKAGKQPNMSLFRTVCEHLRECGAQRLVLGCTELSLIKRDYSLENDICDILEILAKAVISYNGIEVKEKYRRWEENVCRQMYWNTSKVR